MRGFGVHCPAMNARQRQSRLPYNSAHGAGNYATSQSLRDSSPKHRGAKDERKTADFRKIPPPPRRSPKNRCQTLDGRFQIGTTQRLFPTIPRRARGKNHPGLRPPLHRGELRAGRGKDAPLRPLRVHLSSARRGKDEERERQISDAGRTKSYAGAHCAPLRRKLRAARRKTTPKTDDRHQTADFRYERGLSVVSVQDIGTREHTVLPYTGNCARRGETNEMPAA